MKRLNKKYITVALLTFITFFILPSLALGEPNETSPDVLTDIEQRMQKKISVDFRDTPIEDVLRIIASQADVDIIKSPKVTGTVTATLTDIPLEEALDNILAAHGYSYVTGKNLIRVAPVIEINEKSEMLVNRIYRITYADVADVEKALKKFVSSRGSLSSNKSTSNIIVTDTESKIKAIDTFIKEIDRVTPQILVEAKIYDVTSTDRLDLGIEWQAGRDTVYDTTSGVGTLGVNPTGAVDPFVTGAFSGATGKTSGTTGAIRLGWLNGAIDLDMILRAQKENIDAKLLANPRILVLDNETAKIKIVSEIPYLELTESTSGGSFGTTQFREVGVELQVTPHLTRDDMIRLRLKPEFSVTTSTVNVGGTNLSYPQPVVDRRSADTTLLIRDGQTVVLGGLRKKDVARQVNKVPLLGDLPIVGLLFRFEGESTVTSELVVFVTPRIVFEPVLTNNETKILESTEFPGPDPDLSRAEKDAEKTDDSDVDQPETN